MLFGFTDEGRATREFIFEASFFEDVEKEITAFCSIQLRLAAIATAGDKVQIVTAIKTLQSLGHGSTVIMSASLLTVT